MFQILFRASTKTLWLPVYHFFILYWHIQIFDELASTKCLASMFENLFRASTKTHWLPVYYFFILYWQMQIFDRMANTKCLAGMFEILFCASTKTHWLPVYYFSFCTGKCKFWFAGTIYSNLYRHSVRKFRDVDHLVRLFVVPATEVQERVSTGYWQSLLNGDDGCEYELIIVWEC
jgi:hypothetical protein